MDNLQPKTQGSTSCSARLLLLAVEMFTLFSESFLFNRISCNVEFHKTKAFREGFYGLRFLCFQYLNKYCTSTVPSKVEQFITPLSLSWFLILVA